LKIYKLSAYYHANAKKELPYYSVEKSEVVYQIFVDSHLNPDQDLLELEDDLPNYYNSEEEIVIGEEEELDLDKILNLDAFITLEDVIEDSIDVEGGNNEVGEPTGENENNNEINDIEWDPAAEADEIVDTM